MRRLEPLDRVIVTFRAADYEMDLTICRRALVACIAARDVDSMEGLADMAGVSRSTVFRFFRGRPRLPSALAILECLKLRFGQVFTARRPGMAEMVDRHGRRVPTSPPAA